MLTAEHDNDEPERNSRRHVNTDRRTLNAERMNNILEMRGITKTFPGVKALDNVNLSVRQGDIHALVGENGAGKSTLMKVLSGVYPARHLLRGDSLSRSKNAISGESRIVRS